MNRISQIIHEQKNDWIVDAEEESDRLYELCQEMVKTLLVIHKECEARPIFEGLPSTETARIWTTTNIMLRRYEAFQKL